jgi:hypothetical protein
VSVVFSVGGGSLRDRKIGTTRCFFQPERLHPLKLDCATSVASFACTQNLWLSLPPSFAPFFGLHHKIKSVHHSRPWHHHHPRTVPEAPM